MVTRNNKLDAKAPTDAGPDVRAAMAQYRQRASWYDLELVAFEPIRRKAIDKLALQHGQTVMDVGCGTGLSLRAMAEAVGPTGQVVGLEPCPEMLSHAAERAMPPGTRLQLIAAPAEAAGSCEVPRSDAMLLHFTHDVLRTPAAVKAVMARLRPGGRVVAAGLQWAPLWLPMSNLFVWSAALYSTTSLEGLSAPWDSLLPYVDDLQVEPMWAGAIYIATGRRNDRPA